MNVHARAAGSGRTLQAETGSGQPAADGPAVRSAQPAAIEVRELAKTYPKGVRALDGLTFSVAPGTVFALLGPNGAGKSTTVKILTTLAQADSGAASVGGLDVRTQSARVRHAIGVVAQRSGADPMATGRENLLLTGRIQGMRRPGLDKRADELLGRFGLAGAAGRLVRTYSGGMRRRLDVAMGLINRPAVLFLDEPTAGLDPESRSAMWAEIARLAAEESITVLLTTHYLEEADRLADRLAIIDRGRVVAEGAPDELKGRLRGDALQLELADEADADRLLAALRRFPGLREVRIDGSRASARTDEGATALPPVLAALEEAGIAVRAAGVARPSLDDVYLRHTGRLFSDADQPDRRRSPAAGGSPSPDAPAPDSPDHLDPAGGLR